MLHTVLVSSSEASARRDTDKARLLVIDSATGAEVGDCGRSVRPRARRGRRRVEWSFTRSRFSSRIDLLTSEADGVAFRMHGEPYVKAVE